MTDVEKASSVKPLGYQGSRDEMKGEEAFCTTLLKFTSYLLILLTFPISIWFCLRQVQVWHIKLKNPFSSRKKHNELTLQEYERALIFRLGRIKRGGAVGPGMFFIIPCMDEIKVVDLRVVSIDVPPQEILTKDSVTVHVDAVVYYKIVDPMAAVLNVANYFSSTYYLAATTLRTVLGTKTLSEILLDRASIAEQIKTILDLGTDPWGIEVSL